MQETTRTCRTCRAALPLSAYYTAQHANGKTYRTTANCRTCSSTAKRTTYQSDPHHRALQVMYSMETHVKRTWPQAYTASLATTGAAKLLAATHCSYCGTPNDGRWTFSLDHHMPLALGGTHSLDNLHPSCEPCNRAKHDMPPAAFHQWMTELIQRHS